MMEAFWHRYYGDELTLDPTGGTTPPVVNPTPTPSAPGGAIYTAKTNFSPSVYTREQRAFREAFLLADAADKEVVGFSKPLPDKIDLYSLRWPKRRFNFMRMWLRLTGDPVYLENIYELVKPVISNLEYRWAKLPSSSWINSQWRAANGDSLESKLYRSDRDLEFPEYKKLLYLNYKTSGESYGAEYFGTHLHELDNLLGHGWVFWACYILDANRHVDPKYGALADVGYDYAFNHWEPLISKWVSRHPTYRFWRFKKALYHNVAAHAAIYDCFVNWRALPNDRSLGREDRTGKARQDDVVALQSIMGMILRDFRFHNFPSSLPHFDNTERFEFLNWGHHNVEFAQAYGSSGGYGPADSTYDDEWASEILNLDLNNATDENGKGFTQRHWEALSNTYGVIVEGYQGAQGSTFEVNMAGNIAASKDGPSDGVRFSDGTKMSGVRRGGRNPFYTEVRRVNGDLSVPSGSGHARRIVGGAYHWADPTPGKYNLTAFLRRAKYGYGGVPNIRPGEIVANPGHRSNKQIDWVIMFLTISLMNPDVKLADIDIGTFKPL